MEFTGRLAAFPAPNLLQWAQTERVTGTLVIRRSQREKRLGFRSGRIVDCRSNQPQELFGQFLLIHGHLGPEPLAKALIVARSERRPLGETVGQLGLLDEPTLRVALARSLSESIQDLFLWKHGLFFFNDEAVAPKKLEADLDTTGILLEGTRWIDEAARIRGVLVDDGVVVRPGPGLGRTLYSPFERRILETVGEEAALRDLYARTGGVFFPFLEACFGLLEKRALEIARANPERPPASREVDLREVLLAVESEGQVLVGAESALFPLEAIEALVPAWIQRPSAKELEQLPIAQRAFLDGFDGRSTLRKLLSPADDARTDQIELLLLELKKRNVLLLPASLEDVDRRLDESGGLKKLVKRLRG
jgi:hypothetical protein